MRERRSSSLYGDTMFGQAIGNDWVDFNIIRRTWADDETRPARFWRCCFVSKCLYVTEKVLVTAHLLQLRSKSITSATVWGVQIACPYFSAQEKRVALLFMLRTHLVEIDAWRRHASAALCWTCFNKLCSGTAGPEIVGSCLVHATIACDCPWWMCYTDTISAVVIMLAAICNAKSCKPVFVVSASECLGVQDSRRKKRVREREREIAPHSQIWAVPSLPSTLLWHLGMCKGSEATFPQQLRSRRNILAERSNDKSW